MDRRLICLAMALGACGTEPTSTTTPSEALSGGDTTVFDTTRNAFGFSARNLDPELKQAFFVGNSFFNQNWVTAPASTTVRDGLGPVFNALSCSSCHFKDGRSDPFEEDGSVGLALLFRLGSPSGDPEPTYGGQLQPRAIPEVAGEAEVSVSWSEISGAYDDGEPYTLRRPTFSFQNLGYGPMVDGVLVSPRAAPPVFGLGLLEAIPQDALLALEDPEDADADGVSGRVSWRVTARDGVRMMWRFGWKANQPTLEQQNAGAFNGDIGITSPIFPEDGCTEAQVMCRGAMNGEEPEIDERILERVTFYTRTLAVPARRDALDPEVKRGEELFVEAGCDACHVPRHETGQVEGLDAISGQTIYPYTDLLLHDMGPELADGKPDGDASGSEWRTPPLWGAGLVKTVNRHEHFLHDGRARGFAEAILWHGGEGERSALAFRAMSREDRDRLLRFLRSL